MVRRPRLANVEAKVVALEPQLVRIFFNTSAWENDDRLDSFVRTVRLADRANAEINITWQGSTFVFAMRNMDRFANLLSSLLDGRLDRAHVGHDVQRAEHDAANAPRVRAGLPAAPPGASRREVCATACGSWAATSSARPPAIRRRSGSATWPRHMGDLLDAWSVHVYWDFWEPDKIDERLLREVRTIFSAIPAATAATAVHHRVRRARPRGLRGRARASSRASGPTGRRCRATNAAAFQQAWFNIRAAQLGYSGTVKWDVYPAKYDLAPRITRRSDRVPQGWPTRPVYRVLQLMTLTTEPRGGSIVEMTPAAGADPAKLLTAYVSPASDVTILGLHMDGAAIRTTSNAPVPYSVGGLPPNTYFRLLVWNGDGAGEHRRQGLPRHRRSRSGRVHRAARLRLRADEHTDHVGAEVSEVVPTEARAQSA